MTEAIQIIDLGLMPFEKVLKLQEKHFNKLLSEKRKNGTSDSSLQLILCQHEPVFTLGKSGDEKNLLPMAKTSGAEFFKTSRGGDITYHGPGQLVGYPIFDLERLGIGLARYIWLIEESVIRTIADYGLKGERLENEAGVWLDISNPTRTRKICALGVRASRFVTMHGFAFNINTDLRYFDMINPCGFIDKGVTSLEKELGKKCDFEAVSGKIIEVLGEVFGVRRWQKDSLIAQQVRQAE